MFYVRQLLEMRHEQVSTLEETATVFAAACILHEKNIGAIAVISGGSLKGIISERDIIRRVIAVGKNPKETLVREAMTAPALTCHPDDALDAARSVMTSHRFRHLPVVENRRLVGMLSMRDVMEATLRESREDLAKLQSFVYGPACGG
jgi:CBS domain-containing protein